MTTTKKLPVPRTVIDDIVDRIVADLTDRRGLRQEWEQCDEEVQDEIRARWAEIIEEELTAE